MLMVCCIVFGQYALWSFEGSCIRRGALDARQCKIELSFFFMVIVLDFGSLFGIKVW
jgi:hypothetical protein